MINAFYPFHRYHWFQSSSMNFRIIFTVLAVYLYFPCCFFMTYSILLRRFLDTFFSFFRATPLLPHLPMYSCDPLLSSFFRTRQLIISTKNLRVLCTSRKKFFFFSISCIPDIIPHSVSFIHFLICLFQPWLVYLLSHSLHIHTTTTITWNKPTNRLFRQKKHFYNHFLTLDLFSGKTTCYNLFYYPT